MGFIHDTDADPSETRAAKISAGLKKYVVSRANSEFSRVLASINRDRDQAKKNDHPKNEPATCCNPNLYDCHCPFPDDGLAVLASLPLERNALCRGVRLGFGFGFGFGLGLALGLVLGLGLG